MCFVEPNVEYTRKDNKLLPTSWAEKTKLLLAGHGGLTQHKNSVNTIKEIVNLLLLKGTSGKTRCRHLPLFVANSNVQRPNQGIYEQPPKIIIGQLGKVFDPIHSQNMRFDTVDSN